MNVYSIGHSNHTSEHFLGLLQQHQVQVVADVRSTPASRFCPQFNRARLQQSLSEAGIRYEFLGAELGARSKDPSVYENGRVIYVQLAATQLFQQGLTRVLQIAKHERVALMCAEREPLDCHRTILVGREVERAGAKLIHILGDGTLEENSRTIKRLIGKLKLAEGDLFLDASALIDTAYDTRGKEIAYRARPAN